MQRVATHPVADATPRILRYQALIERLRSRQLLSYSAMGLAIRDGAEIARFSHLLQTFFPDEIDKPGPDWDLLDLTAWFAHLVDETLFPLDLNFMDSIYGGTGDVHDVIMQGIPYRSYGVPYEILSLRDLEKHAQPVVAATQSIPDWHEFWQDAGVECPEMGLSWAYDPEIAILNLRGLEPPLDGLEVMARCVARTNQNPFLDMPDLWYRGEYIGEFSDYWWAEQDIRELARLYDRARPDSEILDRYIRWVDADWQHAFTVIARKFVEMEEANNG